MFCAMKGGRHEGSYQACHRLCSSVSLFRQVHCSYGSLRGAAPCARRALFHHRLVLSTDTRRPDQDETQCCSRRAPKFSGHFHVMVETHRSGTTYGESPHACPLAIPNPSESVTIWHSFALSRVQ